MNLPTLRELKIFPTQDIKDIRIINFLETSLETKQYVCLSLTL